MSPLKFNTIHKGDCIELLKKLEPQSIDMVFADPPYNLSGKALTLKGNKTGGDWEKVNEKWDVYHAEDYQTFSDEWVGSAVAAMKAGGSIYICCSQHNIEAVMHSLRIHDCKVNNIIVWQKSNPMPNTTKRLYTHSVEFVVWAVKGKGWTFNATELRDINPDTQKDGSPRMMRDVWIFPVVQGPERLHSKDGRALHPTQKPLELVRRTIVASSNTGDVVLDPFMGSGTTAVAAKQLGRSWIGFERDEVYIEAAKDRVAKTKPDKKSKLGGKMTFKSLVSNGLIENGTELVWKRRVQGDTHLAVVVNGAIQTSDGKLHRTPSGAARHLNNGKPVDGWKVWKVKSSGMLIDSFRLKAAKVQESNR